MTLTVQDVIDMLSDLPPDAELRVANQPNWPFENEISGVMASNFETGEEGEEATVVWLGLGRQIGYLPEDAARLLKGNGWR